jgi:hypothetical protein
VTQEQVIEQSKAVLQKLADSRKEQDTREALLWQELDAIYANCTHLNPDGTAANIGPFCKICRFLAFLEPCCVKLERWKP